MLIDDVVVAAAGWGHGGNRRTWAKPKFHRSFSPAAPVKPEGDRLRRGYSTGVGVAVPAAAPTAAPALRSEILSRLPKRRALGLLS
jgi:hypothetical protein